MYENFSRDQMALSNNMTFIVVQDDGRTVRQPDNCRSVPRIGQDVTLQVCHWPAAAQSMHASVKIQSIGA